MIKHYLKDRFLNKARIPKYKYGRSDVDGRAILLRDFRAIYIPIPKVACTSLKKAFASAIDIDLNLVTIGEKSIQQIDFPYTEIHEIERFKDYKKFVFVRNPWDRLVSCYKDKVRPDKDYSGERNLYVDGVHIGLLRYGVFRAGMPFSEFVKAISEIPDEQANPHFRSQHTFLSNKNAPPFVDFIGKFEKLNQDFNTICEAIGMSSLTLPHSNKSHQKKYPEYYTDDLKKIVEERYEKDIEILGYEF
ncbi:MAG: sulfotransferase family 2 domain-containing protein [Cyanobacteria bacterium J06635_15]